MFDLCFLGLGSIEFIREWDSITLGYVLQGTIHCFRTSYAWFLGYKEYDCCSIHGNMQEHKWVSQQLNRHGFWNLWKEKQNKNLKWCILWSDALRLPSTWGIPAQLTQMKLFLPLLLPSLTHYLLWLYFYILCLLLYHPPSLSSFLFCKFTPNTYIHSQR